MNTDYLKIAVQRIQQGLQLSNGKVAWIDVAPTKPSEPLWFVYITGMTSDSVTADYETQSWTAYAEYQTPQSAPPTPSPEYVPDAYTVVPAALVFMKQHRNLIFTEQQEGVPHLIADRVAISLEFIGDHRSPMMVLRFTLPFEIETVLEFT
jgi:hypothetical protein